MDSTSLGWSISMDVLVTRSEVIELEDDSGGMEITYKKQHITMAIQREHVAMVQ